MAIITEKLQLNKHFLIIDSPVPFTLRANNGTDEVYRMAGAWQIDTYKLLPEEYQKQYPVFNMDLIYDDTNLNGGTVVVRESDIDVGDGIAGVNGQDVKVTNFSEISPMQVTNELDSNDDKIPLDVNITNNFFLGKRYNFDKDHLTDFYNFLKEKFTNEFYQTNNAKPFYVYFKPENLPREVIKCTIEQGLTTGTYTIEIYRDIAKLTKTDVTPNVVKFYKLKYLAFWLPYPDYEKISQMNLCLYDEQNEQIINTITYTDSDGILKITQFTFQCIF